MAYVPVELTVVQGACIEHARYAGLRAQRYRVAVTGVDLHALQPKRALLLRVRAVQADGALAVIEVREASFIVALGTDTAIHAALHSIVATRVHRRVSAAGGVVP